MSRKMIFKTDFWFVFIFGLTYTLNYIDRTIISVLAEPIRRDLNLGDFEVGLLGGFAFSIFYAVVGLPIARVAERRHRGRIIGGVTFLWSIMTALSGAVSSFFQLLLCRIGVGIGEAGFTPALLSLTSARYSASKSAAVFSLIALGTTLGSAIAAVGGAWVAQHYGWRVAFVVVGAPGILVAFLIWLTIDDDERTALREQPPVAPLRAVLGQLVKSPAFLFLTGGSSLTNMTLFGLSLFLIPFLIRRHGFELSEAGLAFAVTFSLATFLGILSGGLAAARLSQRDLRWFGWAPAIALSFSLPLYLIGIAADDWRILIAGIFFSSILLSAFPPSVMAVTQRLVEPTMRASTAAVHTLGTIVIGMGVGSLILGFMSDQFASSSFMGDYGAQCRSAVQHTLSSECQLAAAKGLQLALFAQGVFPAMAILLYLVGARHIPKEIEVAVHSQRKGVAEGG